VVVRLGCKTLKETLTYYENLQITDAKSFITMGSGGNFMTILSV